MTRDALDRYYTPRALAKAVVDRVAQQIGLTPEDNILEPSSGGGAFVDELISRGYTVDTCDIDVGAKRGNGRHHEGDFLGLRGSKRYDLIIGNPPFGDAQAHADHAINLLKPDGMLAFILPMQFWCSQERLRWWESHNAGSVSAIIPRPDFTEEGGDMRDVALFQWWAEDLRCKGGPSLGRLLWTKPPRAVVLADRAEMAGQLPLLGQGHTVAAQPSLFGGAL